MSPGFGGPFTGRPGGSATVGARAVAGRADRRPAPPVLPPPYGLSVRLVTLISARTGA